MVKLQNLLNEKSKGLWHNIHAKRKRGEAPAKPGDEDYPKTLDIDEKVIKVSKKDDVPGNAMKMSGEEKIKKLTYSGSNGTGSYEIKGKNLNVIGIRPRDKGFFVRHFTNNTGFRKANLYYDGVQWQGDKKFESVNENKTLDLIKLYNKALKMMPGSPAQKKILKKIGVLRINLGMNESDLGLTLKKGKTVKVKHKTSGKELVIIDKPNVRKEYEKIGFFAEGSCGYGIDGKVGSQPAGPHLIKKKKKKVDEGQKRDANNLAVEFGKSFQRFTVAVNGLAKSMTNITGDKTDGKIIMKAFKKHIIPFVQLVDNWNSGQQKNPHIDESVNERRQYQSGSQEMNFIVQQLVKYGNTKSDAIKMTQKHYNNVLKRYKEPWFIHPVKKAEIISSLSANESVNEVKKLSDKELVDYMLYIRKYKPGLWNHLKKNPDMKKMINKFKLERKKKKKGDDKWKGLGYDSFESVNEAPGKNHKDQYVGQARVKVKPGTYKGQKVNYHDVSMYRDHKKPYHYYLSIRLAHSDGNKIDHVVDTGTHIQSKAGKWAQGFMKRRMSGTGKERFE